jgi:hypothetical protein
MTKLLPIAIALTFPAGVSAQEDVVSRACPRLAPASGFEWKFNDGPDFYVCYANRTSPSTQLIGVYIGNHPNFQPHPQDLISTGRVGKYEVKWYGKKPPESSPFKAGLETSFVLPSPPERGIPTIAHLWIFSSDPTTLRAVLTQLENANFEHIKF